MRSLYSNLILFVLFFASACSTTTRTTSTEKSSAYSEDLSSLRNDFLDSDEDPLLIENHIEQSLIVSEGAGTTVNNKLNYILDSINVLTKQNKYLEGYTIQVFSGLSREEAMNVKADLFKKMPEVNADLIYTQPSFRVKIGKYYSKLEAQQDYMAIKRNFPNAILVPERIYLDQY
jgi:hypothetical protein